MKNEIQEDVFNYFVRFPESVQKRFMQIRSIIYKVCPDCEELISYGMPAYKLNKKPLVYYAAYENHIGFYATPTGHAKFKKELAGYKQGKGSVQFPLKEKLPLDLIERIVQFRKEENRILTSGKN